MTVAESSLSRFAIVTETAIGTTPATPAFQTMRLLSASPKLGKQVDVPDEIRADGNVASIVDVGRSGSISMRSVMSYGTFDKPLEKLLRGTWTTNVLVNGILQAADTIELTYDHVASKSYLRYKGCRWNTLDLVLEAKKSVTADWGIKALTVADADTAIITGATYAAATTTPVMNAANDVAALSITGMTNAPKVKKLTLKIDSGVYDNDIVGQKDPYSQGISIIKVTGSIQTLFENTDTYQAAINHDDITLSTTIGAAAGSRYTILLPKFKLLDGGPEIGRNGSAVMYDVPFQAYYDATTGGTMKITRAV
jgi:hypothetical protein